MESSKPRSDDLNSRNDNRLKESLAEEDDKTWKKADIIPRRFDELPPESDWIPVADVIRTQREEIAKAEAEQIKIMPPLDSDSESLDQEHLKPHAVLDKEVTQEKGEKHLQAKEKNDNMKFKLLDEVLDKEVIQEEQEKILQAKEKNGNMKLKTLDEDSSETSYEVDAVTRSMMNWVLKPDYFTKKKSTDLGQLGRRNSAPVISLSEYSKKVLPSKPHTSDSHHHYDRHKIPPEHREHRRGSVQLPPKSDPDPQYERHHRYREPSPDYEPYSRYERDSHGSPGLDVDYLVHHPKYDDGYHDPDQDYKYGRYHDSRPHYEIKPPILDLDYGGHYHDPRPHHHDHYHNPEHNHTQDCFYDTSPDYEDDHYPSLYQGSGHGHFGRQNSNPELDHYCSHDRRYVQDFQQSVDTDRKWNYKHQPRSGERSHEPNYLH